VGTGGGSVFNMRMGTRPPSTSTPPPPAPPSAPPLPLLSPSLPPAAIPGGPGGGCWVRISNKSSLALARRQASMASILLRIYIYTVEFFLCVFFW